MQPGVSLRRNVSSPRQTDRMDDYLDDAIRDVRAWDASRERSMQTEIGVSDLADSCRAYIGFRLRGDEPTEVRDHWRASAGTALHAWFTELRRAAAAERGEVADFDVETEYRGVRGHADEVAYSRGEVIDYKFPSSKSAGLWDDPEVQSERFTQVHLYGAAIIATPKWRALAPDPDAMTVRILVAPVDGTFGDWVSYDMPLDISAADEAIERYQEVQRDVQAGVAPQRDKPFFWCSRFCEFFSACRPQSQQVIRYDEITDDELAAAIERYGLATEMAREAARTKEALFPLLNGMRGTARGWNVRMSKPGQDRWVLDEDEVRRHYEQRGEPVPLVKKEGRRAYVIAERSPPCCGAH